MANRVYQFEKKKTGLPTNKREGNVKKLIFDFIKKEEIKKFTIVLTEESGLSNF